MWMRKSENAVNPTNGSFSFTGSFGNPAFANFLLGDASGFSQENRDIIPDLHYLNLEAYVQDDWKISSNFTLNLGLRYSWMPSPHDLNLVLNNFDPQVYNPAAAPQIDPGSGNFLPGQAVNAATYVNGIVFPSSGCAGAQAVAAVTCSPYGNTVNPNYGHNFQPRVGIAWDIFGTGTTVIRSGYGIFYDRPLNGIWEQNAFTDPPLAQTFNVSANGTPVYDLFDHPTAGQAIQPLTPVSLHATGFPGFKVPYYQNWNFSVQRKLPSNIRLEVAYVGGKGTHLLGEVDANQIPLSVRDANPNDNLQAIRPYLGYSTIYDISSRFDNNYNSLQVSLNRRFSSGLSFGIAYTWSKDLTDNVADRGVPAYDSYNLAAEYGPSSNIAPQVFIANYVYDLPFFKAQQGVAGHLLGGWEVSGITTFESGTPFTIYQYYDPFDSYIWGTANTYPGGIGIDYNSNLAPRADVIGNPHGPGTVAEFFNTAAFTDAIGHFGSAGNGIIVGPGLVNWDISAMKNIKFTEQVHAQFRCELFNAFNHASFAGVDNDVDDPGFGRITSTHDPRIIQLGLKLYF
jgi:hypothetical protein